MTITSDAKFIIGVLIATVLVIGGGAYITSKKSTETAIKIVPEALRQYLIREDSPTQGPKEAKVSVVEFGDFQCPACGAVYPVLQQVKDQYKDSNVRFIFRQFPLPQHEFALMAANASLAALSQGKFWEYHDTMFEHQTNLKKDDLLVYAKNVGLDMDTFTKNLEDSAIANTVQRDVTDGAALGIRSTPTLFINNTQYTGKYSLKDFTTAIDAELAK